MLLVAFAHLRRTFGRTIALLVAIALATTSFTVLTSTVQTTRLQVRGTVEENFRSSYDLLVRPKASYTDRERTLGQIRPNYQSGIFGGITTRQVAVIRDVVGVEVAAPVANIGYLNFSGAVNVSVTPYLNADRQQLFRVRPVVTMDRGTSRFVGTPLYVYVSRNKATVLKSVPYARGGGEFSGYPTYAEVVPGRRKPVPVCTNYAVDQAGTRLERGLDSPFGFQTPYSPSSVPMWCAFLPTTTPNSIDQPQGAMNPSDLTTYIQLSFPVLISVIDPVAEAALSGLDRSVISGRTLTRDDRAAKDKYGNPTIPVLAASGTTIEQQVSATIERVRPTGGRLLSDVLTGTRGVVPRVDALPGTVVGSLPTQSAAQVYSDALAGSTDKAYGIAVSAYWTVGPSRYRSRNDGSMAVVPQPNPASNYRSPGIADQAPVGSADYGVRQVTGHSVPLNTPDYSGITVVGQFDPERILGDNPLSGVTSQTYANPLLPAADAASRQALGDRPLAPSSNVAGYAAQPPTFLTTLAGATPFLDSKRYSGASTAAPISVVRVRVAGVTGTDPVSRERLNQAALAIRQRTGLAVDIVAGASGVPTTVVLPAGDYGRPELRLTEDWARKGVAYQVISAVDRKSVALFLLILGVCVLVVGNAAGAAVRTRRVGLGILSCLGWGGARLFGVVLAELSVIGLVAGLLGTAGALLIASVTGLHLSPTRAVWAVPAAVLLAASAGLLPAFRAARAAPMDAVRPVVADPRRARPVSSVGGMALQTLLQVPGRAMLAAVSLGIGVAAMTVLLAVQQAFRGIVVGSLLGDAVALQVRAPDIVALVAILLLGAAGVADVLYLSVREQAGEFAVLRTTGWTDAVLARLVIVQGLAVGVLGGLVGILAGCGAIAGLVGWLPSGVVISALIAAAIGVVLAVLASLIPAVGVHRLPTAALLAEEPS